MNNDMVAHNWAHQNKEQAKNGNGSLYFNGNIIFSYGAHFPIACHINNVVLLTTQTHSVTTAAHVSLVRRALFQKTFNVDYVLADGFALHDANITGYIERINNLALKASRARANADYLLNEMDTLINQARDYCILFNIDREITSSDLEQVKIKAKEQAKRLKAKRAAAQKIRDIELIQDIKEWEQGDKYSLPFDAPVCFRLKNDDTVETSKRAQFPVSDAKKALKIASMCRAKGATLTRNDHLAVGGFRVDSINAKGDIKAGCHSMKWEQIERFALSMGWL